MSKSVVMPSRLSVHDSPAYTHRGILLDTARSYYSVDSLKRLLDGMAMNKLNTFHWHLTDSQSFPYLSSNYPKISAYSAYSASQVGYKFFLPSYILLWKYIFQTCRVLCQGLYEIRHPSFGRIRESTRHSNRTRTGRSGARRRRLADIQRRSIFGRAMPESGTVEKILRRAAVRCVESVESENVLNSGEIIRRIWGNIRVGFDSHGRRRSIVRLLERHR